MAVCWYVLNIPPYKTHRFN